MAGDVRHWAQQWIDSVSWVACMASKSSSQMTATCSGGGKRGNSFVGVVLGAASQGGMLAPLATAPIIKHGHKQQLHRWAGKWRSDVGGNIHYHTAAGLVTDPGWRDSPNLALLPLTLSSLASVHLAKASPCILCNGARKTTISIPHGFICARTNDAKYTWESNTVLYSSLQCTCTLWAVFARSHLSSGLWHVFMLLSSLPFAMKKKQIHGAVQINREETRAAELRWVLICSRRGHKHTQKK